MQMLAEAGLPRPRQVNQNGAGLPGWVAPEALDGEDPGWHWSADRGLLVRLAARPAGTTRIAL